MYEPRIYLIDARGIVIRDYPCLRDAALAITAEFRPHTYHFLYDAATGCFRWLIPRFGEYAVDMDWGYPASKQPCPDVIIRDDQGRHIHRSDLSDIAYEARPPRPWWVHRYPGYGSERDCRRGPVPGIGHHRWHRSKLPHLRGEIAQNESDGLLLVRAKRNRVLISRNDRYGRGWYTRKSWKHYRGTQYRDKKKGA